MNLFRFSKGLMMSLFLLMSSMSCFSQQLAYDQVKDKPWIDSVKRVISRNEKYDDLDYALVPKAQLRYFNSCIALGQYYEKLYKKKLLPSNSLAVSYFEKVTDQGRFPDDEAYFKAAALRNNLCRKLADMYFDGTGIKKNLEKSLALALKGSSGYDGFYTYYTRKYFNCNCVLLNFSWSEAKHIYEFKFNPFAVQEKAVSFNIIKDQLETIAAAFKKADVSQVMHIVTYGGKTMRAQFRANTLIETVRRYMSEKQGIPTDRVIRNVETGTGEDPNSMTIYFSKD